MNRNWFAGTHSIRKIALVGLPGAGKTTSGNILRGIYEDSSFRVSIVKLAQPLYDMQTAFYARLNGQTVNAQNGQLLNFFGGHFRNIAPDFLINDFMERCLFALIAGTDVLICDDARPTDVSHLRKLGFIIVQITAPDTLRRKRKSERADLTTGDDVHITELGFENLSSDYKIDNKNSLQILKRALKNFTGNADAVNGGENINKQTWQLFTELAVPLLERKLTTFLSPRYQEHKHQIATIIISDSGQQYLGIHVEAMIGRASSCSENGAISQFCAAGHKSAILVASFRLPRPDSDERARFVSPCGICREILIDHAGNPFVLITKNLKTDFIPLKLLLPHKYVGTKWGKQSASPNQDKN